jgi:hypothetical protein
MDVPGNIPFLIPDRDGRGSNRIPSPRDDVYRQNGKYETLFFLVLLSKKDLGRVNMAITSFK